jgi:hypothetical protein
MDMAALGPDGCCSTRRLGPPDLVALQALFTRAADYFVIAAGAPPAPDEAERAFVGGPPSKAVALARSDEECRVGSWVEALRSNPPQGHGVNLSTRARTVAIAT